MKKFLVVLVVAAIVWFGYQYGGELWNKELPKRSSRAEHVGEREGIVGPEFGQESPKPAPAATPPPTAAAPVPAGENEFICTREVDAFDPALPARQLGIFHAGSRLQVGGFQPASLMFAVTYQDPGGRVIQALCRPADVGRKPPETPAAPSSGFSSPTSSSPPPAQGGTVSSWRNRVEKATGGK